MTDLTTWEAAAKVESKEVLREAAERLPDRTKYTPENISEMLKLSLEALHSAVVNDDGTWQRHELGRLGALGLIGYCRHTDHSIKDALRHVLDTIAAKQHDYGHDNINAFGLLGLVVRLSDKLARLKNLTKRVAAANESLLDTYLDIVGYAIVGLMFTAGTFDLPLEADTGVIEAEQDTPGSFGKLGIHKWFEGCCDNGRWDTPHIVTENEVRTLVREEIAAERERWRHLNATAASPPKPHVPAPKSLAEAVKPDVHTPRRMGW